MVISFYGIAGKILFCPCFTEISLCAHRHFIQILYWISSDSACLGVSYNSDRGLWICLGRQFGRCPELNASRSLRRISQRRYFCVQLPPKHDFSALTKRRQPGHFCSGCHCGLCDCESLVHQMYGITPIKSILSVHRSRNQKFHVLTADAS
jgi:hypothetical protein